MRSNCILWALAMYLRRGRTLRRQGRVKQRRRRYLSWRWSDWGPFPHVLYCEQRAVGSIRRVSYKPPDPKPRKIPPLFFSGEVRWGDV